MGFEMAIVGEFQKLYGRGHSATCDQRMQKAIFYN